MTPERWERVKAIFHAAAECDPEARPDFLRQRCASDEDLRREVESLLDSERDSRSVLKTEVMDAGIVAAASQRQVLAPHALIGGRYEVERELGRGGMSVVYLARDRQLLEKRVVVKLLLEETGQDPWIRQKFQQEMEALARIDHPGVVGVLDSGLTAEGRRFLVMQYIEGVTLRSLVAPGGMDRMRVAGIIRQIGGALAAAHEKGVWHRDLKPENIMLQCLGGDDHVKLVDFGIAGIQNSQFSGEETKVAGSLAYMAPEQLGGQPCAASDTYALAVVAFEMLTGTLPSQAPEPHPKLPEAAAKSLQKAMSAHPELRHVETREFSEELYHNLTGGGRAPKTLLFVALALVLVATAGVRWFGRSGKGPPPVQTLRSIAVLPFTDLSPAKDQQYLSEGIAEQVLNSLARVEELRVAGMKSSFQFAGKAEDYRVIGRKLNVACILEGSVSKQGNRARINVQLIEASGGFNLWSNTYDREMSDIFAVQDSIAGAVTEALKVTLLGRKSLESLARPPNAAAYNAYLQGRYFLNRNDKESLQRAIGYFEQAIRLDPGYGPSWVGIAEAHDGQSNLGYAPATEEAYRNIRKEIETALILDANLGAAYAALGRIKMLHDWDWAGAEASYQRALVLEPAGQSSVISQSGNLARILGRFDEAVALGRRATEIDPLIAGRYHNAGLAFYYAGLQPEAIAAFRKALELAPDRERTHSMLAAVSLEEGLSEEALVEARQEKNPIFQLWSMALAQHALRRENESSASLTQLIARYRADAPYHIATVYAFRGETDRAFEWLERAYAVRDSGITLIKGDPLLKTLVGDPRYAPLLQKIGLPR